VTSGNPKSRRTFWAVQHFTPPRGANREVRGAVSPCAWEPVWDVALQVFNKGACPEEAVALREIATRAKLVPRSDHCEIQSPAPIFQVIVTTEPLISADPNFLRSVSLLEL
jgi:hypothetical protein